MIFKMSLNQTCNSTITNDRESIPKKGKMFWSSISLNRYYSNINNAHHQSHQPLHFHYPPWLQKDSTYKKMFDAHYGKHFVLLRNGCSRCNGRKESRRSTCVYCYWNYQSFTGRFCWTFFCDRPGELYYLYIEIYKLCTKIMNACPALINIKHTCQF